jgi:hypothetical protein
VPALLALCAAAAGTAAAQSPTPVWAAIAAGPGGTASAGSVVVRDRGSGALYVAGTARVSKGSAIMVVKYDAAGVQQWSATYRHRGAGLQTAVEGALDKAGDFVVLCAVSGRTTGGDWAVLKYAPDGTRTWATTIAGAGHGHDVPRRLALSPTGAAYATGGLFVAHHGLEATVVKLTSAGKVAWRRSGAGPGRGPDLFSALGLDGAGRVFCAGAVAGVAARGADCLIAAYSSAGRRLWAATWGGAAHRQDGVSDLVVSGPGAVYTVGWFGTKSGSQAMIRRYDSGGHFAWQATYATEGGGSAQFVAVALLPRGRVVATGTLVNAKTGNSNIVTVGFAAQGPSLWQQVWDTPHPPSGFSHDRAEDVVVGAAGRVLVCGSVQSGSAAGTDFAVLSYTSEGVPVGSAPRTWNGGGGDDFAQALTPAPGGVVVTGRSQVHRDRFRMATVELPY